MAAERSPQEDRAAIREIVDGWIIWRDSGDWGRLSRSWHPGGRMTSTRFDGLAVDFVAQTRAAYDQGVRVKHMQGGLWCETEQDRALCVTGMSISQRVNLDGVEVDVVCLGSFVDFFAFREGRWALDRRCPAYDRDWMNPVIPGVIPTLDLDRLAGFPSPYRHLAYVQASLGFTINQGLPETRGPSWDRLMAEGQAWLQAAGGHVSELPPPRRVIAEENSDGRSFVAADGDAGPGRSPVPGLRTRLMWATRAQPDYRQGISGVPDLKGIAPPAGGTRFSILDIAPGHRAAALHRTDTLDYVLCLSGRIDLLLDEGSVTLSAGEVAIQCGANHGWANRWSEPARVAVVLVDAEPKRDRSISGESAAP